MTWLFVPGTSSACAQASEDWNSESASLSHIAERLAEGSATSRGKLQPPPAWSRRWKQGGFIRLLSGLTCSLSTLDHGVASFISSLRATPARTTASQESGQERKESGSLPQKSAASPKSAGLILSSAKTYRGTRTDSLQLSSRHWKGWATGLRQEYSARPALAIPCGASDCSSWPSAKVASGAWERDRNGNVYPTLEGAAANWPSPMAGAAGTDTYNAAGNSDFSRKAMELAEGLLNWATPRCADWISSPLVAGREYRARLEDQVANWATPSATDAGRGGTITEAMTGTSLTQQVNTWSGLAAKLAEKMAAVAWPTPAARDHKGTNSATHMEVSTGSMHLDQLPKFVEHCFRLPSSPDQPIAGGAMSSTDSPNSNQPSVKRRLNPIFVEALMRWPTGLSGFERPAMALTLWRQRQLSFLSALFSASDEPAQQMEMF